MVTEHRHRSVLSQNRGPVLRLALVLSLSFVIFALQMRFDYYPPEPPEEVQFEPTVYTKEIKVKENEEKQKVEKKKEEPPKLNKEVRVVKDPPEPIKPDSVYFIDPPVDKPVVIVNKKKTENPPVLFAEVMPEFPGGEISLLKFLAKTEYCYEARDLNVEGTVYAQFVVDEKGEVGDVKIVRDVFPCLDRAVKKRIKKMPKWSPGIQGKNAVKVRMTVPIRFTLD